MRCARAGLTITDLATAEADLEELFLRLTGRSASDDRRAERSRLTRRSL